MSQIKSKERVAERGEVFTAEREVNAMLDLVQAECLRPDSRFLKPACGDGNFPSAILKRKLTDFVVHKKFGKGEISKMNKTRNLSLSSSFKVRRNSYFPMPLLWDFYPINNTILFFR